MNWLNAIFRIEKLIRMYDLDDCRTQISYCTRLLIQNVDLFFRRNSKVSFNIVSVCTGLESDLILACALNYMIYNYFEFFEPFELNSTFTL